MYLNIVTWWEKFSIYFKASKNLNILRDDPFFWAHLPDLYIKWDQSANGIKLPSKRKLLLTENTFSHFPFFLTSYLWYNLLQKNHQLIHWASFIVGTSLFVLLWRIWVGKSTMLYRILNQNIPNIKILCDDKMVLDISWWYFISWNQNLSLRGNIKNYQIKESKFTKKIYMNLRNKHEIYHFDKIKFIKLNNVDNYTPELMSKKELILFLYHNILDIVSGNQACCIDPIITYNINVKKEYKNCLLNTLFTHINSSKCEAYQCWAKDIDFILSLI